MILAALAYVASVYAPPGQSIDHTKLHILQVYHIMPPMHMKYLDDITCTFQLTAILLKFLKWLSCLYR